MWWKQSNHTLFTVWYYTKMWWVGKDPKLDIHRSRGLHSGIFFLYFQSGTSECFLIHCSCWFFGFFSCFTCPIMLHTLTFQPLLKDKLHCSPLLPFFSVSKTSWNTAVQSPEQEAISASDLPHLSVFHLIQPWIARNIEFQSWNF